jgi:hypothetical protein
MNANNILSTSYHDWERAAVAATEPRVGQGVQYIELVGRLLKNAYASALYRYSGCKDLATWRVL